MDKPKEAIERMRHYLTAEDRETILAYLDSIPDGAVPVVWPKELTRERLEELSANTRTMAGDQREAMLAIVAIAPERKKRMVNLWVSPGGGQVWKDIGETFDSWPSTDGWRKVAGPVEIDE